MNIEKEKFDKIIEFTKSVAGGLEEAVIIVDLCDSYNYSLDDLTDPKGEYHEFNSSGYNLLEVGAYIRGVCLSRLSDIYGDIVKWSGEFTGVEGDRDFGLLKEYGYFDYHSYDRFTQFLNFQNSSSPTTTEYLIESEEDMRKILDNYLFKVLKNIKEVWVYDIISNIYKRGFEGLPESHRQKIIDFGYDQRWYDRQKKADKYSGVIKL